MWQKILDFLASLFQSKPLELPEQETTVDNRVGSPIPYAYITKYPLVGDSGDEVRLLQERLNFFGASLTLDGKFGKKTTEAISKFQLKNGLNGSGVLGPVTLDKLGLIIVTEQTPVKPLPSQTITKDLAGKKQRRISLELRKAIEARVFPNGNIPDAFLKKNVQEMAMLVAFALEGMKVREAKVNNTGYWVGLIQSIIGTQTSTGDGLAWCMSAMQVVIAFIEDYLGVESPVLDSEHCMTCLRHAKKIPGLYTETPELGSLIIWQHGEKENGHTGLVMGFVKDTKEIVTIEGNTSDDNMRDGNGIFRRTRSRTQDGTMIVRGYIRIYPNNKTPGLTVEPIPAAPTKPATDNKVYSRREWSDKALLLSQLFEGADAFANITGNFDGAFLTAGALGWTIKWDNQDPLVNAFVSRHGEARGKALMPKTWDEYWKIIQAPESTASKMVTVWSTPSGVKEPYKSELRAFWKSPEMVAIQGEFADKDMGAYAEQMANKFASAMGVEPNFQMFAWFFDVKVHNGGMKTVGLSDGLNYQFSQLASWASSLSIPSNFASTERDLKVNMGLWTPMFNSLPDWQKALVGLSQKRANLSVTNFKADTMNRKGTIAFGFGQVHGTRYDFRKEFNT